MHSTRVMITLAAFLMALGASVAAQDGTSNTILFQTRVETPEGDPIPNGSYPVRFSIYATESDTNTLWTETQPSVSITDGLSNTTIFGETPPPSNLFDQWDSLWLEVAIDRDNDGFDPGDIFNPRTPLHAVPFALYAKDAASLGGSPAEDYAKKDEVYTRAEAEGQFANAGIVDSFNDFKDEYNEVIVTKADQAAVNSALAAKADVSALFQWNVVIGGPVTMQPNRGYIANSATELNFNLPASGTLTVGDIVRVSGIGEGGWQIVQDAGQSVRTSSLPIDKSWKKRTGTRDWSSLASSADGSKLVAGTVGGSLFTSVDFGVTWTARESNRTWNDVASSADGTKLVAVAQGGQIYTSTDSGETWTARESNRTWVSVASSADGNKLVASAYSDNLYTSTDGGVTWTPRDSIREWYRVASSADGTKLVANTFPGRIYTSTDSGVTWTPRETDRTWDSLASSADGNRLAAVAIPGQIYLSTDSGVTWVPRGAVGSWAAAAFSADGTKLLAALSGGPVYRTDDDGLTWVALDGFGDWSAIATSANGTRFVAAENMGSIYTYSTILDQSTPGITGGISGPVNTAIELQYIGNGEFLPLSSSGTISAF